MGEAKQADIKIYSGEDFSLTFIARDPDTTIARDLTNAEVTAQLRKYHGSGLYPYDFTVTNYGASGRVRIQLPHETTSRIGYTYGQYEVKAMYADNTTETLLWGIAFIIPAVTRVVTGTAETILAFNSYDEFPETGSAYRLYMDISAGTLYRWNGSMYETALDGLKGDKGNDGRGIYTITKISTEGNIDTYEIEYTNGTTSTFEVANGASIVDISLTGTSVVTDTYTVLLSDGTTYTFQVTNGASIENISKVDTDGVVDTYLITLTDGTTASFQVRNGLDGLGAPVHVEGEIAIVTALLPDQWSLTTVEEEVAIVGALIPDSDWQELDTGSELGSGTIYYRKAGHQTTINAQQIKLSATMGSDSIVLGTLPETFRPDQSDVCGWAGNTTQLGILTVGTNDGAITFTKMSGQSWGSTDEISFSLTFFSAHVDSE